MNDGPLIVQSDKTLLLEIDHERAQECRKAIAPFAELERSPEHIHTYRLTPLGLWNARAAGHDAEQVVDTLLEFSRYAVPHSLLVDVAETMARYGRLRLEKNPIHGLVLVSIDRPVLEEVLRAKKISGMLGTRIDDDTVLVHASERGNLKQALLKLGWPAEDFAGYVDGEAHPIALDETEWHLRDYQRDAADSFWHGGSGVVVLPCGAGKTLVGAAAMARAQATTLILVTNTVSARQWKDELIRRTSLTEDEIGEYSGSVKQVRPVTIATYQVMTTRRKGVYSHLELLDARDWGLIVYDEVHLLPAPIFRMTANLQARRRIGLTATLVREDGREGDVFSLIGPKRYDAPWKDIESQGWIAPASCTEVRVTLTDEERMAYAVAEPEERYRMASTARTKLPVVQALVHRHPEEQVLVIGGYINQLHALAEYLDAPMIEGATTTRQREHLFDEFRAGTLRTLVISRVGNFSIDLPEAAVAIQVSGSFGSRQEEAQRLGRVLRPKAD
ncbi:DNA repair helicase XPB, partial [Nocardioides sp.]|uniref:DNA repair helicase XPB n=1 Tax=Nocardioides sp. TaxID=35761 RepID=UPI0031FF287E|nr:helicase domain protein [Nocardioides sp.]